MATQTEDRVRELEAALEEAVAERNRLWDELQRRKAAEHEVEALRRELADVTGSVSWRLTAPLRRAKRLARDPRGALKRLGRRLLGG